MLEKRPARQFYLNQQSNLKRAHRIRYGHRYLVVTCRLKIILMFRLILTFAFIAGTVALLPAQVFQTLFPNLSGPELLDSVVAGYKPDSVLDYANSRDTLYAKILAKDDDSIRCIYSGHTLYLDPTQDPTQYVYLNGISLGMNTEHAYPQAKGADAGNARSDMHHLYPARIPVNEARANSPFAEIPDAQTQKWFYKAQVFTSIPAQDKDLYSESKTDVFEPRESVKGDLARAIFYFYTMYRAEADLADPDFFNLQRATLCQWHALDPADSAELVKTWRIAPYQENKPNPFILDCSLARRIYCPELANCISSATSGPDWAPLALRLSPNPLQGQGQLELTLPFSGEIRVRLYSLLGTTLASWRVDDADAGVFRLQIETPQGAGNTMGFLDVELRSAAAWLRQTAPVVLWAE